MDREKMEGSKTAACPLETADTTSQLDRTKPMKTGKSVQECCGPSGTSLSLAIAFVT
jgi:hypothetical protein